MILYQVVVVYHACTVYKIHACNLTGFLLTAAVLLGGLEALTFYSLH